MTGEEYGLRSEFDIKKHKKRFINYLEVMICKDGKVVYAVPSHQMKAEELCCEALDISREELIARCPPEYYYDYMTWLLTQCGAIAVWNEFCVFGNDPPTKKQMMTLCRLKMCGLYRGKIPKEDNNV